MQERVDGYSLNQQELDLELGKGADLEEVRKQADLISTKWNFPEILPKNPTVLMLGGFQGSGKTTVLEFLQRDPGVVIISPDEIRHNLFAQKYPFSEEFVRLVNATKFELVKRAVLTGHNIAIDQALNPDRVAMTKNILRDNTGYSVLSVFLDAPKDVLIKRVSERPQLPGRYRGKVEELEASIQKYEQRYGIPRHADYDLAVDVTNNDPEKVATLIREIFK